VLVYLVLRYTTGMTLLKCTKALFNNIRNYQCHVKETFFIADSSIRIVYTLSRILMEVPRFDQDLLVELSSIGRPI